MSRKWIYPLYLAPPTYSWDMSYTKDRDEMSTTHPHVPYTKDGTIITQNKWPLAIVPDTPFSHLATTGHAHTYPIPNGSQLSALPCALRLCIKATTSRSTCHRTDTLLWSQESALH